MARRVTIGDIAGICRAVIRSFLISVGLLDSSGSPVPPTLPTISQAFAPTISQVPNGTAAIWEKTGLPLMVFLAWGAGGVVYFVELTPA